MEKKYIWQLPEWPEFTWIKEGIRDSLERYQNARFRLTALAKYLGFDECNQAYADALAEEVVQNYAIEGERLDVASVRSSVARHLGMSTAGMPAPDEKSLRAVSVLLDAMENKTMPLTAERLKGWHATLFPEGTVSLKGFVRGDWRGEGPMRVVSQRYDREIVHYEAPPASQVDSGMRNFLDWFNMTGFDMDAVVRAALAHVWFVTIHPFDDGNGRLARIITDLALAQSDLGETKLYFLSNQIERNRKEYYAVLEQTQGASLDVTDWLNWFSSMAEKAVDNASKRVERIIRKAEFWKMHADAPLSERQRKVLNKLLDAGEEFEGLMNTRRYVAMAKVSRATAFRDLTALVDLGMLEENIGKGRNASYSLIYPLSKRVHLALESNSILIRGLELYKEIYSLKENILHAQQRSVSVFDVAFRKSLRTLDELENELKVNQENLSRELNILKESFGSVDLANALSLSFSALPVVKTFVKEVVGRNAKSPGVENRR